ncbi:MAG: PfkB family carbohydrate kinase, partial [Gemmatimonadales bacterium]
MGRVTVVGSINMDIVTSAPRLPRVGETIAGTAVQFLPGGKGANQAVAAARMGATTLMIGRVGADGFGDQMVTFLRAQGVETAGIGTELELATGIAVV